MERRLGELIEKVKQALEEAGIRYAMLGEQPVILTRWKTQEFDPLDIFLLISEDRGVVSLTASLGEGFGDMEKWMLSHNHNFAFAFYSLDEEGAPYINSQLDAGWITSEAVVIALQAMIIAADHFASKRNKGASEEITEEGSD